MSKHGLCRICKKRPPWKDKNCPPSICKQCYHRRIWADRPTARKQRQDQAAADVLHDLAIDDVSAFDDMVELVDNLAGDDDALVEWLIGPELAVPSFLRNQRELHIQVSLQTTDMERQRDLIQNLQRLECTVTAMDGETIMGYLEYNPRSSTGRKAIARLHKLLDRWQRNGHLTWTASRKT